MLMSGQKDHNSAEVEMFSEVGFCLVVEAVGRGGSLRRGPRPCKGFEFGLDCSEWLFSEIHASAGCLSPDLVARRDVLGVTGPLVSGSSMYL